MEERLPKPCRVLVYVRLDLEGEVRHLDAEKGKVKSGTNHAAEVNAKNIKR